MCGQSLEHGFPVFFQAVREGVESGEVLNTGGGDPVLEVLAGAGGEDLGECTDMPVEGGQLGAAGKEDGELASSIPRRSGCLIIQPVTCRTPGGAGATTRIRRRRLGRR